VITGSDVHHLINVLRKRAGDMITAADGRGNEIKAVIVEISHDSVRLEIREIHPAEGRKTYVRLFQAIPRGGKFDWIVEKSCEIGVNEIVPVITERTVPRLSGEGGLKKLNRWEKIALETMKQTGRNTQMSIHHAITIDKIGEMLIKDSLKILLWEVEKEKSLKKLLISSRNYGKIELLIGPEGGISWAEAESLKKVGFQYASLGNLVLKTDTAAIYSISNIYFALE
jgi:16S rRNA (uracil1498-N3)-methyltransferase